MFVLVFVAQMSLQSDQLLKWVLFAAKMTTYVIVET